MLIIGSEETSLTSALLKMFQPQPNKLLAKPNQRRVNACPVPSRAGDTSVTARDTEPPAQARDAPADRQRRRSVPPTASLV